MLLPTAFLILLFFSNSNLISNPTFVSSQSDKELLLEFRNNLTYDPSLSSKLVHWNESINFCRWAGVECGSNGRLSGLDLSLSSSGFSVQIPSEVPFHLSLQELRSLSEIRLDSNNFSSPFPDFLADFPNLEVLSLTSCSLSGVVPVKLLRIKSLQRLHLGGNEALGGSFPEFPSGVSLLELNVAGSNISGQIPSTIKNLSRLVVLNLAMNRFSGPVPSLALLKNLTRIDLKANRLTDRIPDSLWEGLDSLNSVDLSGNSLEGEIPPSLFRLPFLEELLLFNNSFSGFIEASSTDVVSPIRALDLSFNRLEAAIPSLLFELRNLSTLDLSSNKLNGSVELADLQKLTSLSGLVLSYNNVCVRVDETASFASLRRWRICRKMRADAPRSLISLVLFELLTIC